MPFARILLAALILAAPASAKDNTVRSPTKPPVTRPTAPIIITRVRGVPTVSIGQPKVVSCKPVTCGKGNEGKACFDCAGTIVVTDK